MKSAGNRGVVQSRLQMLHVHVLLVAPLGADHMAKPGADQHQGRIAVWETAIRIFSEDIKQGVGTPEYPSMLRLRRIWTVGSFSALKREHCISNIRKRGILAVMEECPFAIMALHLKQMRNAIFSISKFATAHQKGCTIR